MEEDVVGADGVDIAKVASPRRQVRAPASRFGCGFAKSDSNPTTSSPQQHHLRLATGLRYPQLVIATVAAGCSRHCWLRRAPTHKASMLARKSVPVQYVR